MNSKFLNMLGLCRRAGKFAGGHDAAFDSISKNKAAGCYLTQDASERLKKEFRETTCFEGRKVPLTELNCTMYDIQTATGRKAAVFTVNDAGFQKKLTELLSEEDS